MLKADTTVQGHVKIDNTIFIRWNLKKNKIKKKKGDKFPDSKT